MAVAEAQKCKEKHSRALKSLVQNWQNVTIVYIALASAAYETKLKAKCWWSILCGEILPIVLITGVQIMEKTQETLQNIFREGFNNDERYGEAGERMCRHVREGQAAQNKFGLWIINDYNTHEIP